MIFLIFKIDHKPAQLGLVILALITGCTTSNKCTLSFSKRKYTKGFFFNIPDNKSKVAVNYIANRPLKNIVRKDENTSQRNTDLSLSTQKESPLTLPFSHSICRKQPKVNIKTIEESVSKIIQLNDTTGRETVKAHSKKAPAIIAGSIGIVAIVLGGIWSTSNIGLVCILLGVVLFLAGLNEILAKPVAEVPSPNKLSSEYDNTDGGVINPSYSQEPPTVTSRKSKTITAGIIFILLGLVLFLVGASISHSAAASLAGVLLPFEAGFIAIIIGLILLLVAIGITD